MEKKIKTLYIITIIAILAFLGMQGYWLYGRYEFSLREYEDENRIAILEGIDEYMKLRTGSGIKSVEAETTRMANYNIDNKTTSDGTVKRKATIEFRRYQAHKLLGIKEKRKLTPEEIKRAQEIAMENALNVEYKKQSFDASSAPSEAVVWGAFKDIEVETVTPFAVEGLDSVLQKRGISAEIELVVTDSIVWDPSFKRHTAIYHPVMSVSFPYSAMERKSVVVKCLMGPSEVLGGMADSLIIVAVLSLFLIVCLVWQFSMVLKLSRLDKMRNDFVHTMIHELKRPISTLKMCVSSIENDRIMADGESRREVMGDCREALNNLSAYFSRLRDITFNEAGQIPLNFSSFSLREMVAEVIGKSGIPSGKKVEIRDVSAADVEEVCDRLHLSQILGNLIENAVKYSGDDVEICVDYGVRDDGKVYLSVSDTGNGISEGECRHLFDKFYRGKMAVEGGQPGMGLGLSYVKLLVEAHGGTVSVESKEGEGSCFTVKIPQT